jgi:hypothetical protein
MNVKKKLAILGTALIITIISFSLLIFVESNLNKPPEASNVYILTNNKNKGDIIQKEDYKQTSIDKNLVIEGAFTNEGDIINKVAAYNLSKNEQLSNEKIILTEERPVSIPNPIIYCLKVADIGDAAAGKLRSGDRINLIFTQKNNMLDKMITSVIAENTYVDCVFTEGGAIIEKSDNAASAVAINLLLNVEDAMKIDNAVNRGVVRALKIDGSQKDSYKDFRLETIMS